MVKHNNSNKSVVPSPGELTRKWQRKSVAYLFDLVKAGIRAEVLTVDQGQTSANIFLAPTYVEMPKKAISGQTIGFAWGCEVRRADAAAKETLSTPMVMVIGVPTESTPGYGTPERPIESYNDRLFRGGDLLLRPMYANEQGVETGEIIRLGTVVGLNLMTTSDTIKVW